MSIKWNPLIQMEELSTIQLEHDFADNFKDLPYTEQLCSPDIFKNFNWNDNSNKWTCEEDLFLITSVNHIGYKWGHIACLLNKLHQSIWTSKQVKTRWISIIRARKKFIIPEEDIILWTMKNNKNSWNVIKQKLPCRTIGGLQTRMNLLVKYGGPGNIPPPTSQLGDAHQSFYIKLPSLEYIDKQKINNSEN
jgi:hypothetical protein